MVSLYICSKILVYSGKRETLSADLERASKVGKKILPTKQNFFLHFLVTFEYVVTRKRAELEALPPTALPKMDEITRF